MKRKAAEEKGDTSDNVGGEGSDGDDEESEEEEEEPNKNNGMRWKFSRSLETSSIFHFILKFNFTQPFITHLQ